MALHPDSRLPFTLSQGVIRYKQRLWLGSNKELQTAVLQALHNSPIGGHSGTPVTYQKVKQLFYCPSMKADVLKFVQSCSICIQAKPDRSSYPRLLQPLPVPTATGDVISKDLIEGLPRSGSFNAILVILDKYSKYVHFLPLRHPFTAAGVAKLFMDNVYKLRSMACPLQLFQIVIGSLIYK